MDDPVDTPLLATAYDADGDPHEWVLHDVTPRQAVMVRAFLESTPRSVRTRPPNVVVGSPWAATRWVAGWRGRIRTFDLLIQSQAPYRLATRQCSRSKSTGSSPAAM